MDTFSKEERSAIMRRVRDRDTTPEMAVRRLAHRLGYRYRLHVRKLPGCPDLVFPGRRKIIFVHGCFWHGHDCEAATLPASNKAYWTAKRERNLQRDKRSLHALREAGWKIDVIWECETRDFEALAKRLLRFLR